MNQVTTANGALDPKIIESLVLGGDVGKLTAAQKLQYVAYRCKQVGLDPAAQPFQLLRLQGKEVLYATAGATQQLCQARGLSVAITKREKIEDIYCVEARVTDKDGRFTENMGSTPLTGLKGEALSNALLKATTKAIRRTVLAHCGLGMLDETEVETIPGAQVQRGNPLRQEFAALSYELDACKSVEQIDLLLESPEYQDFKARDAKQTSGMFYADVIENKAEQMRKKLPARIELTEQQEKAIERHAAQSGADVAPAAPPVLVPPQEPSPPDEDSPSERQVLSWYTQMDDTESQMALDVIGAEIKRAHKKGEITDEQMKRLKAVWNSRSKEIAKGASVAAG